MARDELQSDCSGQQGAQELPLSCHLSSCAHSMYCWSPPRLAQELPVWSLSVLSALCWGARVNGWALPWSCRRNRQDLTGSGTFLGGGNRACTGMLMFQKTVLLCCVPGGSGLQLHPGKSSKKHRRDCSPYHKFLTIKKKKKKGPNLGTWYYYYLSQLKSNFYGEILESNPFSLLLKKQYQRRGST